MFGSNMSGEPYEAGMIQRDPYARKREIVGEIVAILDLKLDERGLKLMAPISRAVLVNQIHELVITDQRDAGPGRAVNRVAYIGFFEVKAGGVMVVKDKAFIGSKALGEVIGFDETHMPNHMSIVIKSEERKTGVELGVKLADTVVICR